jgi:hypothetical protein
MKAHPIRNDEKGLFGSWLVAGSLWLYRVVTLSKVLLDLYDPRG